ncbi:MAG: hypothetical protein WC900_08915 [Oscillospiraceae bacterium]
MESNKRYVYVVLTQTGTNVSRIIKHFTKAPFNHSSVASDEDLNEMFSFCRYYKHSPLPAGFFQENIDTGVFNMFKSIPCQIYAFPATNEQFEKYNSLINHFKKARKLYSYNLLGLFAMAFGIHLKRKNRFVCSQFVAYMLSESGIADFGKDYSLVRPDDFRFNEKAVLMYSGDIKQYGITTKAFAGA